MYCYSFWILSRNSDLVDHNEICRLTERYNSSSDSYFFMSFYGSYRIRLDAVSKSPLEKSDFELFARALGIDVSGLRTTFSEIPPEDLMKRARFARHKGFLDEDTDILSRFDMYDFRLHRSQYRRRN